MSRGEDRHPVDGGTEIFAPPAPMPHAGQTRILVVDDNEDAAELLAAVLEMRGYTTRVAHDAPTALRMASELAPDIAIVDIGLPGMDGYELASQLRQTPGLATVRLIALTGYGRESDRRKSREAGFDCHLVKPVNLAAIDATLRDIA